MTELNPFCDHLVKEREGDTSAALLDFFRLVELGDTTAHRLAAKHTALEIYDGMRRAALA